MFRTFIVAIAVISSSAATAAPVSGTATLGAAAKAERVITESGTWHCEGLSCSGAAELTTRLAVAACTAVADSAGRVSAFAVGGTAFGEAELGRCNRHVK